MKPAPEHLKPSELQPATPALKTQQVVDWDSKTKRQLYTAYNYRITHNMPFEPEFEAALIKYCPRYNPALKRITGRGPAPAKPAKTDTPATQSAKPERTNPAGTRRRAKSPGKTSASTNVTGQLSVRLKLVSQSSDNAFYNVYVNGKRILNRHANTQLRLFADGTLLGIYGTVTNDPKLPQRPLWILYKTDLTQQQWSDDTTTLNRYKIYIRYAAESATYVNVTLSNNSIKQLNIERLKRQAGQARFEITR